MQSDERKASKAPRPGSSASNPPNSRGSIYAWVMVLVMTVVYILSNIDRQLISILIVPIQRDLGINDAQFGTVQGLAYGLFYAGLCIPIASVADRASRSLVISLGLLVWSLATVASGLAMSFSHMFIARALVGVGESALLPATYSMIGDSFPREKLGRASSVFTLGPFLGSTLAFVLGGVAFQMLGEDGVHRFGGAEFHTWQLTFFAAGIPGIFLAGVIALAIRDPRSNRGNAVEEQPSFRSVLRYIGQEKAIFVPHMVGFPALTMTLYAALSWSPAYLIRVENYTSAQAGLALGGASLIGGSLGALAAGALNDFLIARDRKAGPFEVGIAAAAAQLVLMVTMLVLNVQGAAILIVGGAIFLASFAMPPAIAMIQLIAPPGYRARISAVFLVINISGQSIGNYLIGIMNEHMFEGPGAIKYSLPVLIAGAALLSAAMLLTGRRALESRQS